MFHAGGHKGVNTRGRSSALSRHYPHFLSHVDWKAPLRCGILFCTFSCIMFVLGVILTWLGTHGSLHNVIGESVPITGPILLSVGGLMLILAVRQFYMAHARKQAHAKALQNKTLGVAAITAIAEQDEEQEEAEGNIQKTGVGVPGETCVSTDEKSEKERFITGGHYDANTLHSTCGDTNGSGDYVWPPVAIQHPYYSMAMMVYKDPALFYTPYLSGPVEATSPGLVLTPNTSTSGLFKGDDTTASGDGLPASPSSSSQPRQLDSAVLQTSTLTVHNSPHSPPNFDFGQHLECSKIFPADYLTQYQRGSSGISNPTNAGINNLPNPTAFAMLRTLELQETI